MTPPKTSHTWTLEEVSLWFSRQLPSDWFREEPELTADRDEILVVGDIDYATATGVGESTCIAEFREATREHRVEVALTAERLWDRKVSWAVRCGNTYEVFTTASVPVMTRLRLEERQVLDTLIDAGVARSRSDALGWCVRLVAQHEVDWIERLRDAMSAVEQVRSEGPGTVS
jgi:hypothetical protein